ncbi:hypothetical protein APR41_06225 [Salegentibacter salinarum]|uniref:Uncharacterized protein n=1 Tax=Salegentibacter salinarum TaxID=447422 RepID=A0A2N0TQL8_9FLAO|nr:hypothetical protein [Salegentibacter salinarum]PKD17029.1 hypothetical protein APR41_06225 [Salegentibacter salinarum]SKB54015.1 hypothetical protein SAMN05660903_01268 [Salegentibacter salinarum]
MDRKYITLKNLILDKEKCIGLKFFTDKVVQAMVNYLPEVKWSEKFRMNYILNTPENLELIFKTLRGWPGSIAIISIPGPVLDARKNL